MSEQDRARIVAAIDGLADNLICTALRGGLAWAQTTLVSASTGLCTKSSKMCSS